jgi:hypothetical protein
MFKLKNNDVRSFGFAGNLCVAGSGNVTPPDAAKQVVNGHPFRLPPLFELTEDEMFKSFRGVFAAMTTHTREGRPSIEVFVEGVATPLTVKDIEGWADDYRAQRGLARPKSRTEHAKEVEKAMARQEDPIELQRRLDKEEERTTLVRTVTEAVLAVLRPQAPSPAPLPAPTVPRGKNDEKPEETPAPVPQRTRPRPDDK